LVGRALYEIGDTDRSAPLIEEAAKQHSDNAEAHYYLGLIRDERGDTVGAIEGFLRARELDLQAPIPSWTLTPETFALTATRAVQSLPEELGKYLRQGEVFTADAPGIEVVVDGVDPRAVLLLDAVSAAADSGPPTARVFVYQRNVERLAGSLDLVELEIRHALEREIQGALIESSSAGEEASEEASDEPPPSAIN
jgi:hypothetical protein